MPIYLAQFGTDGPVKIGFSDTPARRLDALSGRLWDDLHLIRLLDGSMRAERALHKRFAFCRIRGEWFRFHPAMTGNLGLPDLLGTLDKALPTLSPTWRQKDPPRGQWADSLRSWMVAQNIDEHAVAAMAECSRASVIAWLRFGVTPRYATAVRLMEVVPPDVGAALKAHRNGFDRRYKAAA